MQRVPGIGQRYAVGAFKHLDDRPVSLHLHDPPGALGSVLQAQGHRLLKGGTLHPVQNDEGAADLLDSYIFDNHESTTPFLLPVAAPAAEALRGKRVQLGINLPDHIVQLLQLVVGNLIFDAHHLVEQTGTRDAGQRNARRH